MSCFCIRWALLEILDWERAEVNLIDAIDVFNGAKISHESEENAVKRRLAVLAVIVAAQSFVAAGPVSATEGYCGIAWGSLPKSAANTTVAPLTNIRGGQHACYDRLVLDFAGKTDGYRVRYVDEVRKGGDYGYVVPVRGGAKLQITSAGVAYDDNGAPTYDPPISHEELVDVTGWQTFRQVTNASHIVENTDIGLGVRARLPYRVFYLDGPGAGSRLVIDVAHRW